MGPAGKKIKYLAWEGCWVKVNVGGIPDCRWIWVGYYTFNFESNSLLTPSQIQICWLKIHPLVTLITWTIIPFLLERVYCSTSLPSSSFPKVAFTMGDIFQKVWIVSVTMNWQQCDWIDYKLGVNFWGRSRVINKWLKPVILTSNFILMSKIHNHSFSARCCYVLRNHVGCNLHDIVWVSHRPKII